MKPSVFARWIAYAVPLALLLETSLVWAVCRGDADAYSRAWALARVLGWSALIMLCAALCVTPAARLLGLVTTRTTGWMREIRRGLGIAAANAAVLHAFIAWLEIPGTRASLFDSAQLRSGSTALLIVSVLLLTSFRSLVRKLHLGFWKELQRLAYCALFFAFVHALQGAFAPTRALLSLAGITFAIGLLRLAPSKNDRRSGPL